MSPRSRLGFDSMLKVGLTGGIACGKSHVLTEFSRLGVDIIDADRIAHELSQPGQQAYHEIVEHFGPTILKSDHAIDRKKLASIVFTEPRALEQLNAILHPRVLQAEARLIEQLRAKTARKAQIVIVDAALMIEVGSYRSYDKLVVVYCSPQLQLQRLMLRDNLSEEQAQLRISLQMPVAEKVKYGDYVIDNSGKMTDTKKQVQFIYTALLGVAMG